MQFTKLFGKGPFNLLSLAVRFCSWPPTHISGGKLPERLLLATWRISKFLIPVGIDPVNWLSCRWGCLSFDKALMLLGMEPVSLLIDSARTSKFTNVLILLGMYPERLLSQRCKVVSLVKLPILLGMESVCVFFGVPSHLSLLSYQSLEEFVQKGYCPKDTIYLVWSKILWFLEWNLWVCSDWVPRLRFSKFPISWGICPEMLLYEIQGIEVH